MEEENKNLQKHTYESQEFSEPSLIEAEIASVDYKEISELEITEEEDLNSQSNKDCSQNRLYIERDRLQGVKKGLHQQRHRRQHRRRQKRRPLFRVVQLFRRKSLM